MSKKKVNHPSILPHSLKSFFPIDEIMVRAMTDPQSFFRGNSYQKEHMVLSGEASLNHLTAQVLGSTHPKYNVEITLKQSILSGSCSCPMESNCKHCVAVCLEWIRSPNTFKLNSFADPETNETQSYSASRISLSSNEASDDYNTRKSDTDPQALLQRIQNPISLTIKEELINLCKSSPTPNKISALFSKKLQNEFVAKPNAAVFLVWSSLLDHINSKEIPNMISIATKYLIRIIDFDTMEKEFFTLLKAQPLSFIHSIEMQILNQFQTNTMPFQPPIKTELYLKIITFFVKYYFEQEAYLQLTDFLYNLAINRPELFSQEQYALIKLFLPEYQQNRLINLIHQIGPKISIEERITLLFLNQNGDEALELWSGIKNDSLQWKILLQIFPSLETQSKDIRKNAIHLLKLLNAYFLSRIFANQNENKFIQSIRMINRLYSMDSGSSSKLEWESWFSNITQKIMNPKLKIAVNNLKFGDSKRSK